MKAFRMVKWHSLGELVEVPKPEPGAGQVLIRIGGAGACHSDLHVMHEWSPEMSPAFAAWKPPFTLGHENAGWVEALGPGVEGWEPGQPVVVSPVWSCRRCKNCRSGADNSCEGLGGQMLSGGLGFDGGLAEYMVAPAASLIGLSKLEPWQAAPLTDAGLTSYHAVKCSLSVLEPDAAGVIIGVGGLGHLAVAYLKELTGAFLIAVDQDPTALELAKSLGADLCLPSDGTPAEAIREATGGLGARAVFDFVGVDATMALAAGVIRPRGRITVVGLGGGTLPLNMLTMPYGATVGYTLGGSTADLAEVVALAELGRVRPKIERFSLDQVSEVYAKLERGEIKGRAVICP